MKKELSNQEKVQCEIENLQQKKRKDLKPQERVRLLQLKLYQKAKQEKQYIFYVLYDKIFQGYMLEEAYRRCKSNNGKPGIDNQTFEDVEKYGRKKFLEELSEELRLRSYKPQAVKRIWIEKENGGERPLGIPTIKDRVAQQACKMVIEPIFEADFDDSSYGFRPKRSAKGAVTEIRANLKQGKHAVYDADLSKYFDTIPHDKLVKALKERISDPRVIALIKQWLKVPVVENGKYAGGKGNTKGTPQGGVISPLLANIYMNILDRIVNNPNGYFNQRGISMIRYADDFILMAKQIGIISIDRIHTYLDRMGLVINAEKSKLVNAKDESFDFLGFRFRYDCINLFGKNSKFWNIMPKPKSCKKIRQNINQHLKGIGHYPAASVVDELNPIIRGWMNYYKIEKVSYTQIAFRDLDCYLRRRLYRFYNRKSQRKSSLFGRQAFEILVKEFGLIKPYKSSGLRPANAKR